MRRKPWFLVGSAPIVAAMTLCAGFTAVRAEVGAKKLQSNNGIPSVSIIVDDPEPFGPGVWKPIFPPNDPTETLNPEGYENGDGPPSTLVVPSTRTPMVVWARNSASGFDVVLSRFVDGAWTTPEVIAGSTLDELDPHLSYDPLADTLQLVYWISDAVPVVVHQEAPADASTWSAPELVSDPAVPSCRPWGVVHEGVLHVVYEGHQFGFGKTPRDIVLARREQTGFIRQVLAVTYYSGELRPTVGSHGGRLWVDWVDSATELGWIRLGRDGYWETTRYEPYLDAFDREFHVRPGIRTKVVTE